MNNDYILWKDFTPEKRVIIESKLYKAGIVPKFRESPNGYASMIIPADENTYLSGAAAAITIQKTIVYSIHQAIRLRQKK